MLLYFGCLVKEKKPQQALWEGFLIAFSVFVNVFIEAKQKTLCLIFSKKKEAKHLLKLSALLWICFRSLKKNSSCDTIPLNTSCRCRAKDGLEKFLQMRSQYWLFMFMFLFLLFLQSLDQKILVNPRKLESPWFLCRKKVNVSLWAGSFRVNCRQL